MHGFEERFDGPFGEGMRWVELAPPGAEASIALVTWFDQMPPGSVTGLVLDTPDARAAFDALRERGVEFTGEVREDPWGDANPADEPQVGGDPQGLPQQGTDKATVHLDPDLVAKADREGTGFAAPDAPGA